MKRNVSISKSVSKVKQKEQNVEKSPAKTGKS